MEGLIPTVYRAIKKRNTRRRYKCISTNAASQAYNIEDFYDIDDKIQRYIRERQVLDGAGIDRRQQLQHRRHQSLGGEYGGPAAGYLSNGFGEYEGRRTVWSDKKKEGRVLRNCKSFRPFSCLTGA